MFSFSSVAPVPVDSPETEASIFLDLTGFAFTTLPNKSVCSSLFALLTTSNSLPKILFPKVLNSSSLKISVSAGIFFSFNLKSSS